MKVLFVPDSLWGERSGHRSSKYLIKAFSNANINIAVYASNLDYTAEQHDEIKKYNCQYYPKSEYDYTQQLFRRKADEEFRNVIKIFNPDLVFYVGTIKNKISINFCIKKKIKYLYLPLTNEYYCIKHYAGVENKPCYKCLNGSLTSPIFNKCIPKDSGILKYIKDKTIEGLSKKRIINAYRVVGYSNNQLDTLIEFGVKKEKTMKLPIFFDPNSADGIKIQKGDRFLITGQFMSEKGLHLMPLLLKQTKGVKYKAIISKHIRDKIIKNYNLREYIKNGSLEIIDFLETHELFLEELAKSKGVLIPSFYPTTGEFTMIESLMLGKPVVVFDSGIHKEIFVNKKNGMIAKIGDLDGYFKKIEQLNNDEKLCEIVSLGAKKLFKELTSFGNFKSQIKKLN